MRRLLLRFLVGSVLSAAIACSAAAAVHVRIAVSPSTLAQCSVGHGILVVANDGTSPILARLCFALERNDTTILGPLCGRVPLAAGERRSHEFSFFVPPRTRPGDYAFAVHAQGSDGSSDQSAAPFTVVLSATPCIPPAPSVVDPNADMLNGAIQGTDIKPEAVGTARSSSWGQLKLFYR